MTLRTAPSQLNLRPNATPRTISYTAIDLCAYIVVLLMPDCVSLSYSVPPCPSRPLPSIHLVTAHLSSVSLRTYLNNVTNCRQTLGLVLLLLYAGQI